MLDSEPKEGVAARDMVQGLPSRTEEGGGVAPALATDPLIRFRAAARILLILNKIIDLMVSRKKNKKKRKKGEIADLVCGVS